MMSDTYRFPYRQEAVARSEALDYQRRIATLQALAVTGIASSISHSAMVQVHDLVVLRGCTPERAVALVTRIPLKCPKLWVA